MIDDDEGGADTALPKWCNPTRAKDMLYGSAMFVRDMLEHQREELYQTYGIGPDEATQSLRYVELAELRAWGIDEMIEAVADIPGQASSAVAMQRRIAMAMKAEAVGDYIHPGDAVLLLERSGLMLSTELREAIVFMSAGSYAPSENFTDADQNRLRLLLGRPIATLPASASAASASNDERPPRAQNTWDTEALSKLQYEANQPGMTHEKLALQYGVARQMIGKALAMAKAQLGPVKATAFDGLVMRNRK